MTVYRAIACHQPYASFIGADMKNIETRKTRLSYRGPLIVCATKTVDVEAWMRLLDTRRADCEKLLELYGVKSVALLPQACTIAETFLFAVRPLVPEDEPKSFFYAPNRYAWMLKNTVRVKPQPVRCRQGLFPLELYGLETA